MDVKKIKGWLLVDRCKEMVYDPQGWHGQRCSRRAAKDGFCKQHHPDAVRARQEKSAQECKERTRRSPLYRLTVMESAIVEKDAIIKELTDYINGLNRMDGYQVLTRIADRLRAGKE
jgi:hypothetical protein